MDHNINRMMILDTKNMICLAFVTAQINSKLICYKTHFKDISFNRKEIWKNLF